MIETPNNKLEEIVSHFKIKIGPTGWSEGNVVEMNGEKILGIQELKLQALVDGFTTVELKVLARVDVETEVVEKLIFQRKTEIHGIGNPGPLENTLA